MDTFNKKEPFDTAQGKAEKGAPEIEPGKEPSFAPESTEGKEKEVGRETEPVGKEALEEKAREEIGKIELTPELKKEAGEEAVKIRELDKEGKVSRLLALAEEKGLSFAVRVAKETGDAYLLDIFHDTIAKDGTYKELPW